MREKSERSVARRTGGGAVLSEIKRCAMREFSSVSEYVYYSLILEAEHSALSKFFGGAALDAVERFRRLCGIIVSLGGDPAINMQIRQSRAALYCRDALTQERIVRILRSAEQSERRGIYALERVSKMMSECDEARQGTERIAREKNELAITLERFLNS